VTRRKGTWGSTGRRTCRKQIRINGKVIRFEGQPCRTLADMSENEIREIEREYGCKVRRSKPMV